MLEYELAKPNAYFCGSCGETAVLCLMRDKKVVASICAVCKMKYDEQISVWGLKYNLSEKEYND
jgi:hypothetical protein